MRILFRVAAFARIVHRTMTSESGTLFERVTEQTAILTVLLV